TVAYFLTLVGNLTVQDRSISPNSYQSFFCGDLLHFHYCSLKAVGFLVMAQDHLLQLYFFVTFGSIECVLLSAVAYDQGKAFSICIPHLIVVSLFFGNSLLVHLTYLRSIVLPKLEESFTVLYSIIH
ncbi:hypothetical protein E2320_002973, partial [Naja naja]